MPMFDIESADTLRLRDCTTDAETMVKATGKIGQLDAEGCKAGGGIAGLPPEKTSIFRKILNYCISSTATIVLGVIAILIGAFFVTYLNL